MKYLILILFSTLLISCSNTLYKNSDPQQTKWGFTENTRKEIWVEMFTLERKAVRDIVNENNTPNLEISEDEMENYMKLIGERVIVYKSNLKKNYKIDKVIMDSIFIEGVNHDWEIPSYDQFLSSIK